MKNLTVEEEIISKGVRGHLIHGLQQVSLLAWPSSKSLNNKKGREPLRSILFFIQKKI